MAMPTPKNRTNVRSDTLPVSAAFVRPVTRVLSAVAPEWTERKAYDVYVTPRRPRHPRAPVVPGHVAHRFAVPWRTGHLAAWDWGEGPTILLVHGWGGSAAHMEGFIAPLLQAGFHVAAFDQPAHGLSSGERTNVLEFREAIMALDRRVGPVYGVIAHSLGATASLLALDRGMRAHQAVLLAPPVDVVSFLAPFAARIGLPAPRVRGIGERIEAFLRADLGDETAEQVAARMTISALVVHDVADRMVPVAHGHALASAWPRAIFQPVSGLGHGKLVRDPAVIGRACRFLQPSYLSVATSADQRRYSA
jgi:pimeloyl-ACP methyl ester carboxylesterase